MLTLIGKFLRDLRTPLVVIGLLLCGFQALWVKITQRVVTEIAPFFGILSKAKDLAPDFIQSVLFRGPGKIMETMAGGENMKFERAIDMLSIGYVHPLMQTLFCIWAIGRAAGAVAGELDRGTMELLMAQPVPRTRLILSHLAVDLLVIPILCLSLWGGTWLGTVLTGPFHVDEEAVKEMAVKAKVPAQLLEVHDDDEALRVEPGRFGAGLWNIGALMFAISGYTMWLSARGRFRGRVMGMAILITLMQFAINLVGQLWDTLEPLRPFSVFYYFQPQKIILHQGEPSLHPWTVDFRVWNEGQPLIHVPVLAVLFGVGILGYLMALWTFKNRDLPAPL